VSSSLPAVQVGKLAAVAIGSVRAGADLSRDRETAQFSALRPVSPL